MRKTIDWQEVVNDLIRKGYTNGTLADAVSASPQLFTMIRAGTRGHNPTYEVGVRLIDLWQSAHIPVIHESREPNAGQFKKLDTLTHVNDMDLTHVDDMNLTHVEDMNLKSIK